MTRASLRLLLTWSLLCAPLVAGAEETISVSGSRVRLGDILPDAPSGIASADLGPAPPPGKSRYLDPSELASRLHAQGIATSSLKLPRGVRVESKGHLFTPDELTSLVASSLSAAMPEGITLLEHTVSAEHLLSPSVRVGTVHLPDFGSRREVVTKTATVELMSGKELLLRLPVKVKVRVSQSVREALVERGTSVTLSIVRGPVEVSGVAETLRAAKIGESVSVRVLSTNKLVTAMLVGADRARLEMPR